MTGWNRAAAMGAAVVAALSLVACGGSGGDPPMNTAVSGSSTGSSSSGSSSSSSSSGSSSGSGSVATGTDVLTYHYDNQRTGQNLKESALTPAKVTVASFGLLHMLAADDPVDAAPLIVTNVRIAASAHNVVYVVTEKDSVYAFDADSGALLVHVSLLASGETPSGTHSCGQVSPEIGITSTPVVDRSQGPNGTLYVVAMSQDSSSTYHQRLHALDLTTLADRVAAVDIAANAPGTGSNNQNGVMTFSPGDYKERGALLAVGGKIYTAWASHCDQAFYNGWIIVYDEADLTRTAVLNYTPDGTKGAIWNVAGLTADSSGNIYGMVGNGTFDTTLTNAGLPVGGDYGNAIMKMQPSGSALSVVDYYTAANTVSESTQDVDLGSGSPMLLPDLTDASGTTRHLLIGAGKDGNLLLIDRDHMGQFNGTSDTAYQRLSGGLPGGLFAAFAYFGGSVYVADVGGTLKAFSLDQARLSASPTSQSQATFAFPGSSPSVSANGQNDAIVWTVTSNTGQAAILHAYNPANLAQEYYNSSQAANGRDAFGNGEKFITPVVANGKVFIGTPSGVAMFGQL